MAGRVFGGSPATIAMLMLIASSVGAETESSPWSGNATAQMCYPPVLLFASLGFRDNFGPVVSVGGLNQTVPLFGIDYTGNNWTTGWVNLTKEHPEVQFIYDVEGLVNLVFQGLSNGPTFVRVIVECPITDNITCTIKYTPDDDTLKKCNGNCDASLKDVTKGDLAQWIDFDVLRNHSQDLKDRWGPICEKIANVSDPGNMHIQMRPGDGQFMCTAWTPSPTRFWLTTNATTPPISVNATYIMKNDTGVAHLEFSVTNGTDPPSCNAESVLGWSLTTTSSGGQMIITDPGQQPSEGQLQRLVGRRGTAGPKDECDSNEFQFLVVVLIISFLVLLVIYLFFKERIHVWVTEKVLSRFGTGNKPVSRAGFRPVI